MQEIAENCSGRENIPAEQRNDGRTWTPSRRSPDHGAAERRIHSANPPWSFRPSPSMAGLAETLDRRERWSSHAKSLPPAALRKPRASSDSIWSLLRSTPSEQSSSSTSSMFPEASHLLVCVRPKDNRESSQCDESEPERSRNSTVEDPDGKHPSSMRHSKEKNSSTKSWGHEKVGF